jgi:hypothetical protein
MDTCGVLEEIERLRNETVGPIQGGLSDDECWRLGGFRKRVSRDHVRASPLAPLAEASPIWQTRDKHAVPDEEPVHE